MMHLLVHRQFLSLRRSATIRHSVPKSMYNQSHSHGVSVAFATGGGQLDRRVYLLVSW